MAIGYIPTTNRLGIANCGQVNQARFVWAVFFDQISGQLPVGTSPSPANILIYQEQLAHSTSGGTSSTYAAADWGCGTADEDVGRNTVIREIFPADTQFARRNISYNTYNNTYDGLNHYIASQQYFYSHRANYGTQIYYVGNEPDGGHFLRSAGYSDALCGCWDPKDDRGIDPEFAYLFAPYTAVQFWQPTGTSGIAIQCVPLPLQNGRRIHPDALAFYYLRLRRTTRQAYGYLNHAVLVPSSIDADYGVQSGNTPYWDAFFDKVYRSGVTISGQTEPPISITPQTGDSALRTLHVHCYSYPGINKTPLQVVAEDSGRVRSAVTWFRNKLSAWFPSQYNQYSALPIDLLISEMGPLWGPDSLGYAKASFPWCGIFNNLRQSLNWWNSWLCWITRVVSAPESAGGCNIQGNAYGGVHEPDGQPFVARDNNVGCIPCPPGAICSGTTCRNQWYFNADAMNFGVYYNAPIIAIPNTDVNAPRNPGTQGYRDSFSAFGNPISFNSPSTWIRTPLGACFSVWAHVGGDAATLNSTNMNSGWVSNTWAGVVGSASLNLPAGYSSVYFPVIKADPGSFSTTTLSIRWLRGNQSYDFGSMALNDFQDTGTYTWGNYSSNAYSAMMYPVVCYSAGGQTINVQISRTIGGTGLWLGRPIVLKGACSWFVTQ